MAYFDYTNPALAPEALQVELSVIGALILLISGALFLTILIRGQRAPRQEAGPYRFSLALHPPTSLPVVLNSHGLWITLMIVLTITNYGFPILNLVARSDTSVPAVYVGAQ